MVSAPSVPRSSSPALVPGIVAASAAPEPATTIANDAAASLMPLALFLSAISDSSRPRPPPPPPPPPPPRRRAGLDAPAPRLIPQLRLLPARSQPGLPGAADRPLRGRF